MKKLFITPFYLLAIIADSLICLIFGSHNGRVQNAVMDFRSFYQYVPIKQKGASK